MTRVLRERSGCPFSSLGTVTMPPYCVRPGSWWGPPGRVRQAPGEPAAGRHHRTDVALGAAVHATVDRNCDADHIAGRLRRRPRPPAWQGAGRQLALRRGVQDERGSLFRRRRCQLSQPCADSLGGQKRAGSSDDGGNAHSQDDDDESPRAVLSSSASRIVAHISREPWCSPEPVGIRLTRASLDVLGGSLLAQGAARHVGCPASRLLSLMAGTSRQVACQSFSRAPVSGNMGPNPVRTERTGPHLRK